MEPTAIVMTHGAFRPRRRAGESHKKKGDAANSLHELEVPYLNGTASYPPPDSMVGGGIICHG